MPKRKPITTLPLFQELADADQAKAFLPQDAKADDRAFKEERRRASKARKHIPLAKAPATGPACLRCAFWLAPRQGDEFGECRHLVKTLAEAPWSNVKAGTITDRDTAREDLHVEYEPLRTGEAFSCSSYRIAHEAEAA